MSKFIPEDLLYRQCTAINVRSQCNGVWLRDGHHGSKKEAMSRNACLMYGIDYIDYWTMVLTSVYSSMAAILGFEPNIDGWHAWYIYYIQWEYVVNTSVTKFYPSFNGYWCCISFVLFHSCMPSMLYWCVKQQNPLLGSHLAYPKAPTWAAIQATTRFLWWLRQTLVSAPSFNLKEDVDVSKTVTKVKARC
jgi:hypothetical protein